MEEYRTIVERKTKRYGERNTTIIGKFTGKDNAFLIQNVFLIIRKYLDHVHMVENIPVTIYNRLNRDLTVDLREVLAMYNWGIRLIFPDIKYTQRKMEEELI